MARAAKVGSPIHSVFNNCVADMLIIAQMTKPASLRVALKCLRTQYTDDVRRRRFYDGLNVLYALRIVPITHSYKRRSAHGSMTRDTEAIYQYVHSNPGPYVPNNLCKTLNVVKRRVYDVFAVLRLMGLLYRGRKHYGLTSKLDPTASYWWAFLCSEWGEVDRNTLLNMQVLNLGHKPMAKQQQQHREEERLKLKGKTTVIPAGMWTFATTLWVDDILDFQESTGCYLDSPTDVPDDILQDCSPADDHDDLDQLAAIMRESDIPPYDQLCLFDSDIPLYEGMCGFESDILPYDHMCVSETAKQQFEDIVQSL